MAEEMKQLAKGMKHLEKKLRGILLGEDHGCTFSTECESTHSCLQRLMEAGINLPTEEIAATYHQLKNKEIIISIHGRHNCGKSTLINALLGHRLLPTSIMNATGVMVRIEHDDTVHEGMCQNYPCEHCPKLSMKASDGGEVTELLGCQKIYEQLKKANKDARTASYQVGGQREFTLTTNVPMLASAQGCWKIVMLDNPGFGESHQEHMTQRTKTTLKTSSAYLVVMDISQLADKEDEHCLKTIYRGDKGAIDNHGRVLIALTKYDTMYQEREEERMSEKDVKGVVQEHVHTATGGKISDDAIVPVCGKWALHAMLLRWDPSDKHSQDQVATGLKLLDVPCGQREDPHQNGAVNLEGKTNIKGLERGIQEMVSRCAYIWIDTMTSNYHRYIKVALHMLTPKCDEANERLRAAEMFREDIMKHYETAADLRAKMQKSTLKEQSEIYEQLCMSACSDVQVTKERVIQLVQDFHAKCKGMIDENRHFGVDELRREINKLLNKDVRPIVVVEICNASERFCNTVTCKRTAVMDVDKYIRILSEEALEYMRPRPECQSLPIIVEGEVGEALAGNEEERDLDGIDVVLKKEKLTFDDLQQHLDIPSLEIPWTKTIADRIRALLHALAPGLVAAPVTPDRSDIVANVMGKLQELAEAATENYLNEFKQAVTEFFFRKYCESVQSRLNNFQEHLGHTLDKQKSNDDRCIEFLRAKVKQLTDEETCLTTQRSKVTQKAEKYRNVLNPVQRELEFL